MRKHHLSRDQKMRRAAVSAIMVVILSVQSLHAVSSIEGTIHSTYDNAVAVPQESDSARPEGIRGNLSLIPIPISNPTIGNGLGAVAMYMHPKAPEDANAPTTSTGIFGMYTSTDSWGFGAFHDGYYLDDRVRFRIPAGYGSVNLNYYGKGSDSPLRDNPIGYNASAYLMMPRVTFQLPATHWFLGAQYRLINITTALDINANKPMDSNTGIETQTSGLGAVVVYDSRDSNYWPNKGKWMDATLSVYSKKLGGDYDYQKLIFKWAHYIPLNEPWVLVYRLDGQYTNGRAPFWDLSKINLRGYPADQFLDNTSVTAQAEMRWHFFKRWTAAMFLGAACVADSLQDMGSSKTLPAGGGGIHYTLREEQRLVVGIDFAKGEGESVTVYFQIGDWMTK